MASTLGLSYLHSRVVLTLSSTPPRLLRHQTAGQVVWPSCCCGVHTADVTLDKPNHHLGYPVRVLPGRTVVSCFREIHKPDDRATDGCVDG